MPGCIVSATTASFNSVEKRRLRATPVIASTFENASDIGVSLGLCLGPPAIARVRPKRGALHIRVEPQLVEKIDAWRAPQRVAPSRSAAIVFMLEQFLERELPGVTGRPRCGRAGIVNLST